MKWTTKITKLTGIKYPVIMGAFAGIGRAKFAAAFSNAGGLGIITALNFSKLKKFKEELELMEELTTKPYGINFTVAPPMMAEKNPKARTEDTYIDYLNLAMDYGVKFFTTSAYKASKLGDLIHERGCYWFHKCSTIPHALSAEKDGADAVTLVGIEGTGFKNPTQQTSLINITIGKKLLDIPIIAAGGFGEARGFLAALTMGAEAICFGTAIMATKECPAPVSFKNRLINQDIFDEEYYKKIYHFQLKDKMIWSPASGHSEKILTMDEFMRKIIGGAEDLLKSLGFNNSEFKTL
jgi:nitronate monooxygenase